MTIHRYRMPADVRKDQPTLGEFMFTFEDCVASTSCGIGSGNASLHVSRTDLIDLRDACIAMLAQLDAEAGA